MLRVSKNMNSTLYFFFNFAFKSKKISQLVYKDALLNLRKFITNLKKYILNSSDT